MKLTFIYEMRITRTQVIFWQYARPRSAVGNLYDCKSRGLQFQSWPHTFREIDHEIISRAILLPSADSRRVFVSYKRNYVHEVLVNHLVKLAQEKCVVRWTDCPNRTIVVEWDIKLQTKQNKTSDSNLLANKDTFLPSLWFFKL